MGAMATTPLATRIKRARELRRWTQQQLADVLGVDRKTVDNWENGRTRPRSAIGALEQVLGVNLTEPNGVEDPKERELEETLIRLEVPAEKRQEVMEAYRRRAQGPPGRAAGQ